MNCSEVRALLPEFVYGGLAAEARSSVEAHLNGCSQCRREAAALGEVRRLLDAAPPPPAPRVDLAALYREAAGRQARRLRRWRRTAVAACAVAAALLILAAVMRLEIHAEAEQVVIRWGSDPAVVSVPAPAPVVPTPTEEPRELAALQERVRTLSDLVQALADDGRERDVQQGQEIARLQQLVRQWQGTSDQRWGDMEKDFDALYTAQFPSRKGVQP